MALSLDSLAFLRRNYGTWEDQRLAKRLGCTIEEVQAAATELCLSKSKRVFPRKMPRWSAAELELLRTEYPLKSNLQLARELGRSTKSIVSKAAQMKLRKDLVRLARMGDENVRLRRDRLASSVPNDSKG